MKPHFTPEQFKEAKSLDKLPCECYQCKNIFYATKHMIQIGLNPNQKRQVKYCSKKCVSIAHNKKEKVKCHNCNIEFEKKLSQIKKCSNNFCSHSCSATYNNKRKNYGYRRSKLEKWIEEELNKLYPTLLIEYNKTSAINSELDIYIPSLHLAFELNGIFHYEPIYGEKKLDQIQNNDMSKSKACHDAKIDLCIIDTSQQTYVKPKTSQKYLDIITNIINERLSYSQG